MLNIKKLNIDGIFKIIYLWLYNKNIIFLKNQKIN